jgi:hypothetical protein
MAKVSIGENFGYISSKDEEVIKIRYAYIGPFKQNIALVRIKNLFGLVDRNGNEIMPVIYHEISEFNGKGIAKVRLNHLEGKINRQGYWVEPIVQAEQEEEDSE